MKKRDFKRLRKIICDIIERGYDFLFFSRSKMQAKIICYKVKKVLKMVNGLDKYKEIINNIESIKKEIMLDFTAIYNGDPAAKSIEEIVLCYPGAFAIYIYRIAHFIYELEIPLISRIMSEYAHSKTGIDIHPGAKIGKAFCIDHGTGIVIGETCEIGNNVKIYQGVTLGAISLRNVEKLRDKKRHPTIKNNVTIYSSASILGGETVIGNNVVIGANAIILSSIEDNNYVLPNYLDLNIKNNRK